MSGTTSNLNPRIRFSFSDPRFIVIILGLVGLLILPFIATWANDTFLISFFAKIMIFAIAAASLDLILGYGGMVSFGHAAYIGLGAYAVAVWSKYSVDNEIAWMQSGYLHLITAVIGSAIVALLIGAISLRTSGLYFIMITLAFTQMLFFLGVSLEPYGGDDGMNTDRSDFGFFTLNDGLLAADDLGILYYVCLGFLLVFLILLRRIVNSRFGLVIRGSYSNPTRMQALGFPVYRYRLTAFVIAGAICGVGGALFANHQEFLTPEYMTWLRSGEIMIMVILGGIGTIFGPVFGAISFLLIEEFLSELVGKDFWMIVFGPFLVLFVLTTRRGIFGLIPEKWDGIGVFLRGLGIFLVSIAIFLLLITVARPHYIILGMAGIYLIAKFWYDYGGGAKKISERRAANG